MVTAPLLQIGYRPDAITRRLLISHDDRQLLIKLADRDTWVALTCWGEAAYEVRVQAILEQLRFDPWLNMWGLPINLSASLLRAKPS